MAQRKTIRSRRLGKRITQLRQGAQLTQDQAVERINLDQPRPRCISVSHLSRVESGLARIEPEHLAKFVQAVGADELVLHELEDLRRRADERGWWQDYRDAVTPEVEMLTELGEDCRIVRTYDTAFVQGLLQTRQYAEAVIGNARAYVPPINIERLADLRMRRRRRLSDPDFQGLVAVMSESVIRSVVGGPDVMRDQLHHLAQIVDELPVTLHIWPFTAGALPGVDNFVLFEFPDESDGDVVYVDSETAQRIYEDRDNVRRCTYTHNAAVAGALSATASLELIKEVAKEL